jgi:hypothetical protein
MKIKLSKSQWIQMGKAAGWTKDAIVTLQDTEPDNPMARQVRERHEKFKTAMDSIGAKYDGTGFYILPRIVAKELCKGELPSVGKEKEVSIETNYGVFFGWVKQEYSRLKDKTRWVIRQSKRD